MQSIKTLEMLLEEYLNIQLKEKKNEILETKLVLRVSKAPKNNLEKVSFYSCKEEKKYIF